MDKQSFVNVFYLHHIQKCSEYVENGKPKYQCKNLNKKRIQPAKKKPDKDYFILMVHCLIAKKVFKCLKTENILQIVWYNQK